MAAIYGDGMDPTAPIGATPDSAAVRAFVALVAYLRCRRIARHNQRTAQSGL